MPVHETQETITAWATATFGPDGSDFRIVARAFDELAELVRGLGGAEAMERCEECRATVSGCVKCADPCGIGSEFLANLREEAADVTIVLVRLAERHGFPCFPPLPFLWSAGNVRWLASTAARRLSEVLCAASAEHRLDPPPIVSPMERMAPMIRIVVSAMGRICALAGGDLVAEVDAKMAINRQRQWNIDAAGRGYHVHAEAPEARNHLRLVTAEAPTEAV